MTILDALVELAEDGEWHKRDMDSYGTAHLPTLELGAGITAEAWLQVGAIGVQGAGIEYSGTQNGWMEIHVDSDEVGDALDCQRYDRAHPNGKDVITSKFVAYYLSIAEAEYRRLAEGCQTDAN